MAERVAVTGAEGFIGSHLVEELVGRGYRVRAMVLYNMYSSRGWLETLPPGVLDEVEVVFGDVRDPASVRGLVEGAAVVYHLAALGSVPYSYCRSAVLRGHQRHRHAARAGGGAGLPDAAAGPHLDQRDVRDGADGPDQRGSPAAGAVAVRGVQDRGGQAGGVLLPQLRDARGDAAAVQYVRPAAVGPGRHPGGHHPARRGVPRAQAGRAGSDPGLLLRHRHRPGVRGAGRGAVLGGARGGVQRRAREPTCRSASWPRTSPGSWGVQADDRRGFPSGCGRRTRR